MPMQNRVKIRDKELGYRHGYVRNMSLDHPSFLRGKKSKVDELGNFYQGSLEVPLGPQKDQETNTFIENCFPFSRAEI